MWKTTVALWAMRFKRGDWAEWRDINHNWMMFDSSCFETHIVWIHGYQEKGIEGAANQSSSNRQDTYK